MIQSEYSRYILQIRFLYALNRACTPGNELEALKTVYLKHILENKNTVSGLNLNTYFLVEQERFEIEFRLVGPQTHKGEWEKLQKPIAIIYNSHCY